MDNRKMMYTITVFIVLILGFAFNSNTYCQTSPIISIVEAHIKDIGDVSVSNCTIKSPCSGLKKGSTLYVRLNRKGYAAAYLQDKWGNYYNQEGRLFIYNNTEGITSLWPGTSEVG